MSSIQTRLTVYIIAGTATLLLIAGTIIDRQLSVQLEQEFERNLLAKAMTLVTLTEQDAGEVEFDLDEELMPEFGSREKPEYFQLWLHDGETLQKSSSLENSDLQYLDAVLDKPNFLDLTLPDGRPGKLVVLRFAPRIDEDEENELDEQASADRKEDSKTTMDSDSTSNIQALIALAQGREELDQLLLTTRTTLVVTFLILMVALAALAQFSIKRGLRPLNTMAKQVKELDASNLHVRLPPRSDCEELVPITDQLNNLLSRLDEAFQREKRFSGNVAHELRTPISELRAIAEVGKGWPEEREMVESFFGDLVGLADDMERTVVNLLTLARLDAGNQEVKQERFSLNELIDSIWKRLETEVKARKVVLDNRLQNGIKVQSDKDKLKLILMNVLYNAVSYSPEDSVIVIDAEETDSGLRLSISNETANLSEQDLPLLFERFWRKDQTRTAGNHAGLGLSLVKSLADLLNLKIKPLLESGNRFTLSLSGLMPA